MFVTVLMSTFDSCNTARQAGSFPGKYLNVLSAPAVDNRVVSRDEHAKCALVAGWFPSLYEGETVEVEVRG